MVNKFEVGSRILGVFLNIFVFSNKCWFDRKIVVLCKFLLWNLMLFYL